METVVLPDNGFGGLPAGMNHWQIVNTTARSMGEGEDRKGGSCEGREGVARGGREREKEDEEGMGRIKAEIPWLLLFATGVR